MPRSPFLPPSPLRPKAQNRRTLSHKEKREKGKVRSIQESKTDLVASVLCLLINLIPVQGTFNCGHNLIRNSLSLLLVSLDRGSFAASTGVWVSPA